MGMFYVDCTRRDTASDRPADGPFHRYDSFILLAEKRGLPRCS